MATKETTFENKCNILATLWMVYRETDEFADFFKYNDVGLPIAFAIATDMVMPKDSVIPIVNETFRILLDTLLLPDYGYKTLEDISNRLK